MKTKTHLNISLTVLLLLFSLSASAYQWTGYFITGSGSGCGSLGRSVYFTNSAGCQTNVNVSITLQRNVGGSFVPVETKTSTICNTEVYFSGLTQSGEYRFKITGTVNPAICGVSNPIDPFTSDPITLTVVPTPTPTFNLNGAPEQYYSTSGNPNYFSVTGCVPIKLNYTGSGGINLYKVEIVEKTSTGGNVSGGYSYASGWVIGAVPSTITLPLLSTSKYYFVTLTTDNGTCYINRTSFIYTNPNGPTASIAYKANGSEISTNCSAPSQFYSCSAFPIALTNQSTNSDKYIIILEKSTSGTCSGPFTSVYNSGEIPTFPTDLKNMSGTNGTYLQSHTGFYRIAVAGINVCGVTQSLVTSYFQVASEPQPVATFKVNGTTLPTACEATIPAFFSCPAFNLNLNNLSTNAVTYELKILYHATDPCAIMAEIYNSGIVPTIPSNLKNLPIFESDYISNHPGYYMIVLVTHGSCTALSFNWGFMRIVTGPTASAAFTTTVSTKASGTQFTIGSPVCTVPYNTGLTYINGGTQSCGGVNGYTYPMETSNVSNANPVGRNWTALNLANVGAGIGSQEYSITVTCDIWRSSNNTWENMNLGGVPEHFENQATIQLNNLLDYDDIDDTYEFNRYFAVYAQNNEIFRITLTVQNECGSATQSQIIKLNTSLLKKGSSSDSEENTEEDMLHAPTVFPNPATSDLRFEIPTADKDKVSIVLFDFNGAHVMDVVKDSEASEGMSSYKANLDKLTNGMYLYEITLNNTVYKGKISKQ